MDHARIPMERTSQSRTRAPRAALALASFLAMTASATPAAAAHSLETFVLAAGGVSYGGFGGCTTFMAPAPVGAYFGGAGVGLPLDGMATCHVAGDHRDQTSLTGPLTDVQSLNTTWSEGTLDGSTDAQADYGALSAASHAAYAGSTSSTSVRGTEGFSRCNDRLVVSSPSVAAGQPGTVRFIVTVTGGLSTTATGIGDVELNYQFGPTIYTMFRSQVNNQLAAPYVTSIGLVGIAGFTTAPGSMSGSGQPTTFAHAIVFGTPFDFNLGLFAYSIPGGATGATVDSDFEARITGVVVTGPGGQPVPDFVAVGSSGTTYISGGLAGVDDPSPRGADDEVRLTAAPNPAVAGARLSFRLPPRVADARLEVFDATGRVVRRLQDSAAGPSAWWDGRDDRGSRLPGGTYYARLRWDGGSRSTRIVLVP